MSLDCYNQFSEKFAEVRDLTKQQIAPPGAPTHSLQQNGESGDMPPLPLNSVQNVSLPSFDILSIAAVYL